MPWEEHVSYFIKSTLDTTLKIHGYNRTKLKVYKYNQENALVGIYQKKISKNNLKFLKISYLQKFNRGVKNFTKKTKKFFLKNSNKTVILFGAGHNSNAFFNILNLKETNLDIVDDNKNKLNCFFAGTRKKIKSSNLLKKNFQSIVLLTLNYEAEKKFGFERIVFQKQTSQNVGIVIHTRDLNYIPKINWEMGLRKTVKLYSQYMDNNPNLHESFYDLKDE